MRDVTELDEKYYDKLYISTHTSHAGRDMILYHQISYQTISTHTSHAGRDGHALDWDDAIDNFYSHVPCGT